MPSMRRREFVSLIGGATVAWPLAAAQAQQLDRMRRVAFLHGLAESDPEVQARMAAFREGLASLGWVENRNIQIEHRFASGDIARIQQHVAELMTSPPDVIAATGTPVIAALKQATGSIPIVFSVVNDPAGQGLVANLARPGGNITGLRGFGPILQAGLSRPFARQDHTRMRKTEEQRSGGTNLSGTARWRDLPWPWRDECIFDIFELAEDVI